MIARHNKLNMSLLPQTCFSHALCHLSQWQIQSAKIPGVIIKLFLLSFRHQIISKPVHSAFEDPATSPSTCISCLDFCNNFLLDLVSTLIPLLSDLHTIARGILLNVNLAWDETLSGLQGPLQHHSSLWSSQSSSHLAFLKFPEHSQHTSSREPLSWLLPLPRMLLPPHPAPHHPDSHVTHSFSSSVLAQISLNREAQATLFKTVHTHIHTCKSIHSLILVFHYFPHHIQNITYVCLFIHCLLILTRM